MASQQESPARRQSLPPHQVDCMWWKKGYCFRGTKCYFRHDAALAGVDKDKERATQTNTSSTTEASPPNSAACPSADSPASSATRESCAICLETPVTYGLLIHCDHVFCLECIRNWRSSSKSEEHGDHDYLTDPVALSKNTKTCPLCRKKSDFVIPSSVFPTPPTPDVTPTAESGSATQETGPEAAEPKRNLVKEEIIQSYLAKLKKIPCRYFEEEVKRWRDTFAAMQAGDGSVPQSTSRLNFEPQCYFANKCHYAHISPITNEPYDFSPSQIREMKRRRFEQRGRELRARFHFGPAADHLHFLTRSIGSLSLDDPDDLQEFHVALTLATMDHDLMAFPGSADSDSEDDSYADFVYDDYDFVPDSPPRERQYPTEWLPDHEHERRYGWGLLEDTYL